MDGSCHHNETITFFYTNIKRPLYDKWSGTSMLVMVLGITMCLFIMLANVLVMLAVYINKKRHHPIYFLMANLAVADFFAGAAYVYLMFNTGPNTHKLSLPTWMLREGLINTSLTASVASLLAIAIERHITVFRMQMHSRMSERRVAVVIAIIWLVSIITGAIPSMGWNCICNISTCSTMAPLYSTSYVIFWAGSNLSTFLIMVGLYGHIFVHVWRNTIPVPPNTSRSTQRKKATMSLLITVTIMLGAFIVCWTPGLVILLLDSFCSDCNVLGFDKYFLLIAELNSAMNPIIYLIRDEEMVATLQRILCCQKAEAIIANGSDNVSNKSTSTANHNLVTPISHVTTTSAMKMNQFVV
ncbi:lysophosphatidic acid receptor 1-A-like [Petromyzon marinus]|uniref:Lysophosphatidic acid receptor 1-A-like n=1 Tax=Petromyzon marinus TaxID=7757 RepID=A0AAJ7SKG7_PETMA|nr:lysophosphatidic acid receptor 1-A-like [Petromyzon marinus]